jgi:hypothetical protein
MNFLSVLIKILTIILCFLLFSSFSAPSVAKDMAGVHIDETYSAGSSSLVLNGSGIRSKFFMDLYVASLYLSKTETDTQAIIDSQELVIQLDILSSMITSEKMNAAIDEGFNNATNGQTQVLGSAIARFMATFDAPIQIGDRFVFEMKKDSGVSSIKNGIPQGEIQDELFRRALINIWLGDEPAQGSLKDAMLGIE